MIDGTCPCEDFGCSLCISGLIGSKCLLCKNGYSFKGNDCICEQKNCEVCGEDKCIKCIRGFYFNDTLNECVKNDCSIKNCEYCGLENDTEDQNICYRCEEGNYYDNGNCTQLTEQVEEYERCPQQDLYEINMYCDAKCTGYGCEIDTYIPYIKKCYSNNCIHCNQNILYLYSDCQSNVHCDIEGCNTCLTENVCARFDRGYKIDLGLCIRCIEGCSVCSNNYTCDYCLSGYELNSNKKCVFTNNYDFNVTKYKSLKQSLSHESLDITINTDVILNCNSYRNGKCIDCQSGYLLKNGDCQEHCSDSNCLKCELDKYDSEKCYECRDSYLSFGGSCYIICFDPFCISCNLDPNYCQQCTPGKIAVNGKCLSDNERNQANINNDNNIDNKNDSSTEKDSSKDGTSIIAYIVVVIIVSIIIFAILYILIKKIKRRSQDIQNLREINIENRNNHISHYINNDLNHNSQRKIISEKCLEKEFEKNKVNNNKGNMI